MEPFSMAEDEHHALQQLLQDEELARIVADANDEAAIVHILEAGRMLVAVMLWRNRTGADLKSAMTAVDEIRIRHNIPLRK